MYDIESLSKLTYYECRMMNSAKKRPKQVSKTYDRTGVKRIMRFRNFLIVRFGKQNHSRPNFVSKKTHQKFEQKAFCAENALMKKLDQRPKYMITFTNPKSYC
jgi:hypothetical protein